MAVGCQLQFLDKSLATRQTISNTSEASTDVSLNSQLQEVTSVSTIIPTLMTSDQMCDVEESTNPVTVVPNI